MCSSEQPQGKLLRVTQVAKMLGIGKSTVWAWVKSGRLLPPIKLGPRVSVWRDSDIADFIERAAVQNNQGA
jgi:excisionase family DNA binding protein